MYRQHQLEQLFANKRILIAGYGREGRSTHAIVRQLVGEKHVDIAENNQAIEAALGREYDMIIKSPGIPLAVFPEQVRPLITSQTDIFMQVYADRVIGITGTKGKSTTTSLVHHLLADRSVLGGNIGIPLFDTLEALNDDKWLVAELSCHQLEILHRSPHIAVILNLFQEHLDHYGSYLDYKMAKMQIALHQSATDHFFYNACNADLVELVDRHSFNGSLHPFGETLPSPEREMVLHHCMLDGAHNRINAEVACAVVHAIEPYADIAQRLSSFKGLPHRLQLVGTKRGVRWYNDSISTIPEATIAALKSIEGVETLILGGFDRGIDYSPLTSFLEANPVKNIAFVGAAGRRMYSMMGHTAAEVLVEDNYEKIIAWCDAQTATGKACLLSPAAASYDAFKNFEERGRCFTSLVEALK
ncbi:MAG: UDP-N-acetylmuramoyl-L-alanine--D-glutamate ligase [Bacteroidales bacterium]|nr:UDP-N-acetylmuramoyl-L-alanine--D-glutamate ligase [Bacteroidales bacterium]